MVETKVLSEILQERYDDAHKQLMKNQASLPAEYKGFIDEHLKSLEKANSDLKHDINFYSMQSGNPENVIKSFKIHCAEKFLNILIVCQPERILGYGITYAEYITPNKQH